MQTHENIDVSSITKEYCHFIAVNLTDQVKNLFSKANDLPYPLLPLIKIIGERQTICLINLDGLPSPTRYYTMKYSKEQKIWIIETYTVSQT
jgi:tRNA A37 N6-isopentenylltransferase MiaA